MDFDLVWPFEFADSLQGLAQDGRLEFKLGRVSRLLIVAAATLPKIDAARIDPGCRWLHELMERGPRKPGFFFHNGDRDFFTGKHKWNEDRFALGIAGQAVPSINHFFDGQVHM